MRSDFWKRKRKTLENTWLSRVWWRLRDSIYLWCSRHPAGGWQLSTGELHLDGFESRSISKRKHPTGGCFLFGGDYGTRTCDLMRVKHAL